MKYIFLVILFYFAYRTYIRPLLLTNQKDSNTQESDKIDDSEYIDYEEVD